MSSEVFDSNIVILLRVQIIVNARVKERQMRQAIYVLLLLLAIPENVSLHLAFTVS